MDKSKRLLCLISYELGVRLTFTPQRYGILRGVIMTIINWQSDFNHRYAILIKSSVVTIPTNFSPTTTGKAWN